MIKTISPALMKIIPLSLIKVKYKYKLINYVKAYNHKEILSLVYLAAIHLIIFNFYSIFAFF